MRFKLLLRVWRCSFCSICCRRMLAFFTKREGRLCWHEEGPKIGRHVLRQESERHHKNEETRQEEAT